MKMPAILRFVVCLLPLLPAWVSGADDNRNIVEISRLPALVTNAVHRALPQWEIKRAERDDGVYRIRLSGPGGEAQVKVTADGEVRSIEQEVQGADLPEKVRKALERAFPRSRMKEAAKETKIEVFYVIEVQEGDRKREVKVNSEGKILEVERK